MGIIEREIEKRQAVIDSKADKEHRLEELKTEFDALQAEIAEIDVETLNAEIEELSTYLPHTEETPVEE